LQAAMIAQAWLAGKRISIFACRSNM